MTNKNGESLSYSAAGVDITHTDAVKKEMADILASGNPRVLNGLGPFASLYDINFPSIKNPVLVLKAEEPGSKQKLAMQYGYVESIAHDMINHLVNDIAVMGATPLAVLDTIVCGEADRDTVKTLVKGMADACRANECALVGGETSVQPGVVDKGVYILTSSVAGIVDRAAIIDGAHIADGDAVLGVASNGLLTNGYSLARMLMERSPGLKDADVGGESYLEAIMRPHRPYYKCVKALFPTGMLKGMAHITGGGIEGNLSRVMPDGLCAHIDLPSIKTLPVFGFIKTEGRVADEEMLRTFNCGIGLVIVTAQEHAAEVARHVSEHYSCYPIGTVRRGEAKIAFEGALSWR